jgi:hypothetical protein
LAGGFGTLGALGIFAWAVWKFIVGDKEKESEIATGKNGTVFHEKVKIEGDFVQGDKKTFGGGGDD